MNVFVKEETKEENFDNKMINIKSSQLTNNNNISSDNNIIVVNGPYFS